MNPPRTTYQLYLRVHRGGTGVSFRAARDEFLTLAAPLKPRVIHESSARMRLQVVLREGSDDALSELAPLLGYTEAVFRRDVMPHSAVEPLGEPVGRFLVGRHRFGAEDHVFTPLYLADEDERLAASPHNREFLYLEDGEPVTGQHRHVHRRLSPCDARLLLNLAGVREGLVVDPFAGIGGIALEAVRRGARVLCGDIDASLGPGLAGIADWACIWDARCLPMRDGVADAVVTEPPYHRDLQRAACAAVPEMARILKPGRSLALMVTQEMAPDITRAFLLTELRPTARYAIRRGAMHAAALVYHRPE